MLSAVRIAVSMLLLLSPVSVCAQIDADPRALVRSAEEHLESLARDASDSAVLIGVPTTLQRERVRSEATQALSLCIQAANGLANAIEALETDPAFFDDPALRDRRSELAVEYGEFRLPLVRARSALLLAALNPSHARTPDLLRVALNSVMHLDLRDPVFVARRATIIAIAGALGASLDAGVIEEYSETAFSLAHSINAADAHASVEATLQRPIYLAAQGHIENARRLLDGAAGSAPFLTADGVVEPAWRLLLADVACRIDLEEALDNGPMAQIMRRRAYGAYTSFLKDERTALPLASRRALVIGRVDSILPTNARPDALPPIALLALAARNLGDAGFDVEAIRWLSRTIDSTPIDDNWMRAELSFALASQLLARAASDPHIAPADFRRALALLVTIADDARDWPGASAAMEAACQIATRVTEVTTNDRDTFRETLRFAVLSYPYLPTIDRWRLALSARTDDPDEELALLTSVPRTSALFAQARVRLLSLSVQDLQSAQPSEKSAIAAHTLTIAADARTALAPADDPTAMLLALRTNILSLEALLVLNRIPDALAIAHSIADKSGADQWLAPLSNHLLGSLPPEGTAPDTALASLLVETSRLQLQSSPPQNRADAIRATLARALVGAGEPEEASLILKDLRERIGPRIDILRTGAEAAFATGNDERAFDMYRQIVTPLEAAGTINDDFWLCWSRMLQILARRDDASERTITIQREILRLKTVDAALGGDPYATRIDVIAHSVNQ